MPKPNLSSILEAILFTASEPLTLARLAALTNETSGAVESALQELGTRLTGGIRLAHDGSSYRLVTAPEAAETVRRFLEDTSRQDLTRPALETLAIVAYRGPITKGQIEEIRGVASETMLRNLTARGLISEAGRSTEPGRPMRYVISHAFLQHFGLTSTTELPELPEAPNAN
jgi:segregation and condensation protein B